MRLVGYLKRNVFVVLKHKVYNIKVLYESTCVLYTLCSIFLLYVLPLCRSQWPHGLRRKSTAARPLRSWVRYPLMPHHGARECKTTSSRTGPTGMHCTPRPPPLPRAWTTDQIFLPSPKLFVLTFGRSLLLMYNNEWKVKDFFFNSRWCHSNFLVT